MMNRHRTIGVDLVNHCVNDILVQGALPLFFLDYLATGRLSPDVAEQIVEGLARGCQDNGCALLGGETAEMPGFYADGEYDVAGFIVGAVDRAQIIDGRSIAPGDMLIGLPSNGLHTNGYSLARKVAFESLKLNADSHVPDLGETVGDALLRTHRSYLPVIKPLLPKNLIKGMAHITGGGITENLPRVLPAGTAARVNRTAWRVPAIFRWIGEAGRVPEYDLRRALNMGIGMVLVVAATDGDEVRQSLLEAGEANSVVIGDIVGGEPAVNYV
jgi:phosphoribosylformylglycinamidine cyclo-ligase